MNYFKICLPSLKKGIELFTHLALSSAVHLNEYPVLACFRMFKNSTKKSAAYADLIYIDLTEKTPTPRHQRLVVNHL